jgi:hypothetical protein
MREENRGYGAAGPSYGRGHPDMQKLAFASIAGFY